MENSMCADRGEQATATEMRMAGSKILAGSFLLVATLEPSGPDD